MAYIVIAACAVAASLVLCGCITWRAVRGPAKEVDYKAFEGMNPDGEATPPQAVR